MKTDNADEDETTEESNVGKISFQSSPHSFLPCLIVSLYNLTLPQQSQCELPWRPLRRYGFQ